MAGGIDRRRAKRSCLPVAVPCGAEPVSASGVLLIEVSSTGCRIQSTGERLPENRPIVLQPKGIPGLSGIIRWVVNEAAGIQFDRPLQDVVLRHLLYVPDGKGEQWTFVDAFGRRLPPASRTI